jgi:hypothetical protein
MGALEARGRTRLFLGEAGAAVTAHVAHRSASGLSVRHALPFLRLESEVTDEEGRSARIASVRVDVEDDVPTLHMELVYEATEALRSRDASTAKRRDPTLPYGIAVSALAQAPSPERPSARGDDTLVFPIATDDAAKGALSIRTTSVFERLAHGLRALFARVFRRLDPQLP